MPIVAPPITVGTTVPSANTPFTITYRPTVNGQVYDPANNGGSVSLLTLYSDAARTSLVGSYGPAGKVSDGQYLFTVAPGVPAGTYWTTVAWSPDGSSSVSDVNDTIVVYPFDGSFYPTSLCTVDEAKLEINKSATYDGDDDELALYCEAAVAPIEDYCGPVLPQVVTETGDVRNGLLVLRSPNVISVTSVTRLDSSTGTLLTEAESAYLSGDVYRRDGSILYLSGGWYGPVTVTYTAGMESVPAAVNLAARKIVASMWRSQQGGAGLPDVFGDEDQIPTGTGDMMIPPSAMMLLDRYRRPPSVA